MFIFFRIDQYTSINYYPSCNEFPNPDAISNQHHSNVQDNDISDPISKSNFFLVYLKIHKKILIIIVWRNTAGKLAFPSRETNIESLTVDSLQRQSPLTHCMNNSVKWKNDERWKSILCFGLKNIKKNSAKGFYTLRTKLQDFLYYIVVKIVGHI